MWIAIEKTIENEAAILCCRMELIPDSPDYEVVDIDNAWPGERKSDVKWLKTEKCFLDIRDGKEIVKPPKNGVKKTAEAKA